MTLYWIHNRPHIAVSNGYQEISIYEAQQLEEHNEITRNEEVYYD
ncbi:hypothetical protein P4639_14260 [Priestia megaterium]|nr:hypothetical protein [Priestia megaterium]